MSPAVPTPTNRPALRCAAARPGNRLIRRTWPDNEYSRTECLLAHDATGVAERLYGRRLTLRLSWPRPQAA